MKNFRVKRNGTSQIHETEVERDHSVKKMAVAKTNHNPFSQRNRGTLVIYGLIRIMGDELFEWY